MSIFGKIKDAIFGHKAKAAPNPPTARPNEVTGTSPNFQGKVSNQPTPAPAVPAAVPEVDVEHNLAEMAQGKNLNWRSSIVDLMKLLGIDPSLDNRKELARELGYSGDLGGSAGMNIWLHMATMRELAKNGGKVSAELTDREGCKPPVIPREGGGLRRGSSLPEVPASAGTHASSA